MPLSWARDELVAEQLVTRAAPHLPIGSRLYALAEALSRFDEVAARQSRAAG